MPSIVWNYFTKEGSKRALCTIEGCKTSVSYAKGTSGMRYHLRSHGIIESPKRKDPAHSLDQQRAQQTISDYVKDPRKTRSMKHKLEESFEEVDEMKRIKVEESSEDEYFETCRLCLQQLEFRMSVKINKKIEQQFLKLIGIELKMSENYSKIICEVCDKKLKEFSEYQQKLYEIQKKLYQDHEELESNFDEDRKSESFNEEDQNFDFNPLEHIKVEEIMVKLERIEDEESCIKEFKVKELKKQSEKVSATGELEKSNKNVARKKSTKESSICTVCGKIIRKSSMKKHMNYHDKQLNDNAFTCDLCGHKCYHGKQQIWSHISKNHLEKDFEGKFNCGFCPRSFNRAKLKKIHEREVHNEFSCFCGKSFRKEDTLYRHRRTSHVLGSYKCPVEGCGQEFSASYKLLTHKIREHEPQRACEVCGELVLSGKFYTEHMYKHDPPKLCPVEGCGKMLKKHAMDYHLACSHGPDLKLKCPTCNAEFANKTRLTTHIRLQHTAPKKPCLVHGCKYSTARKGYMAMHIKNHRDISHDLMTKLLQDLKSIRMS